MHHPSRGGVRGGADQFSWDTVKTDKYRENYLGHSLKAPVGRWQKGKDLQWYNKDRDKKNKGKLSSSERDAIRQAEDNAINAALGHKPIQKEQQSLNKEDLAEALKRNQGDRDAMDTERVEGVGIASGRASMLSGSGSKSSEGVDFVVPVTSKRSGGMGDKKETEAAKEISDDGKDEQFQESPQTDMKKKKHKKKEKKHKKKKKKKKKLMKLSMSGEKADRKGKKKQTAQQELPEKKMTKEKIRHDSDSDSEAEERIIKEPPPNLTMKKELTDAKKSLNIHHMSSKQEKDISKTRHEEKIHPVKDDVLKKLSKISEDKRREDKTESTHGQQRQSHKNAEAEKTDQIRKHRNQSTEELEGKKKIEPRDSSTDSEPRHKKSENKHLPTQNTLHRGENVKNSKHKDIIAEKRSSEVSDRHSLQKSRQDNITSIKISDAKSERHEKISKDHNFEKLKDKLETSCKTGKEKKIASNSPKHHTETVHEITRQTSVIPKNEKSNFSKLTDHERKSSEIKNQRPKDSQRSKSRFDSEHKSEHNLRAEIENENIPTKTPINISTKVAVVAPLAKHSDLRNEYTNTQPSSVTHSEKPEINKWQLDSSSESEDEKKVLKYDDKHKFHEAPAAYSLAKSNQVKKVVSDKSDKKSRGSRSSNKSKSSSDELTSERNKAKAAIVASNEDSNSSDSHNQKTLVSKDYDNKSDRRSDLSGSEEDNSKLQSNNRKHAGKDSSVQHIEKPKSESPRSKEVVQKLIRKISNESIKRDSSSSSSDEDKKHISKKAKKGSSSSSGQEDKSDSDRESSPHKVTKSKKDSRRRQSSSSSSSEDEREKVKKRKAESSKKTKVTRGRKDTSSSSEEEISKRTTDKKSSKRDLSSDSYSSHSDHKSRRNEMQSRHKGSQPARREDKNRRSPSSTDSDRHSPPRGRYGERGHQSKARRDSSSDSEPRQSASRNWDDRRSWPRRQQWSRNWNDNRNYRWPQQQRYQRNFGRRQIQPRWQNNRSNMDRQSYRQGQYSRNPRDRYGDSNRRRRDSSSESSGRGGTREREKSRRSDRGSGTRRRSSSSSDSDDHSKQIGQDSRGKGEKRNYRKRHDSSSDSDPRAKRSRGGRDNTKSSSQKRRYSSDSS